MTLPIEEEIKAVWNALAEVNERSGWQVLSVSAGAECKVMAARHYPENEEAVLIGFKIDNIPNSKDLPKGKGFRVEILCDKNLNPSYKWIGLIKVDGSSLDIFMGMVCDVLNIVSQRHHVSQSAIFSIFLARIRSWQDFMSSSCCELSSESEIGLFGELFFLRFLLQNDLDNRSVVRSWHGPIGGLQDFYLGQGAVEVKSTLASEGFIAKVFSLEQLDDSDISPIFIEAIRLKRDAQGLTLPMLVSNLRHLLKMDLTVLAEFENLLLRAGYLDSHESYYTKSLSVVEMRNILVDSNFPRLTRTTVNVGIRAAKYEIDLDKLDCLVFSPNEMLTKLEVI